MILELADVQFLRVEAEEKANISIEFQVAAVPTVLFIRGGTPECTFLYLKKLFVS